MKIGYSNDPGARLRGLQTANEDGLVLEAWVSSWGSEHETDIHSRLDGLGERVRGEWFSGKGTEVMVVLLRIMGDEEREGGSSEDLFEAARRICPEPDERRLIYEKLNMDARDPAR